MLYCLYSTIVSDNAVVEKYYLVDKQENRIYRVVKECSFEKRIFD